MGRRGPVPKRSSERRRRNKDGKTDQAKVAGSAVKAPPVSGHWHPAAKAWFRSLAESGQSQFFEPSDWQAARLLAEAMSRHLKSKRPSAVMFAALWSAMGDLLTTEASRRRVRIEIERTAEPEHAEVTALDEYRRRVG